MPRICYQTTNFRPDALAIISTANEILEQYAAQGYDLTLRQLYYQFVSKGLIPNKDTEYKRLGDIISNARMGGMIDWNRIVDRTRELRQLNHWTSPEQIIEACAAQYRRDLWDGQEYYVETWIEKDALIGVLKVAAEKVDIPYFSCRGYTSQSEMWVAARRLLERIGSGRKVIILHLGDHDPSGIDMTRDIHDRLRTFLSYHTESVKPLDKGFDNEDPLDLSMYGDHLTIERIALNMDQVRLYNPPPNPAKLTDARAQGYIREFGNESWELDALPPDALVELVRSHTALYADSEMMDLVRERMAGEAALLAKVQRNWDAIPAALENIEEGN